MQYDVESLFLIFIIKTSFANSFSKIKKISILETKKWPIYLHFHLHYYFINFNNKIVHFKHKDVET